MVQSLYIDLGVEECAIEIPVSQHVGNRVQWHLVLEHGLCEAMAKGVGARGDALWEGDAGLVEPPGDDAG